MNNRASGTAKRVDRLIAQLLFPRVTYGCVFEESAGFLLAPNIPKTLPSKPFFFSGSGGVVSPGAAAWVAGVEAADCCPPAGGGGFPFFPKRWDSQFPWARCPPCSSHVWVGSVPETKYSLTL